MFILNTLTTLLAVSGPAMVALVQASPLSRRDVIAPKITSPTAGSVWTIGAVETVTWDTSNFPPDSQITNPIGKVILGFEENNSLNLDFDHPLASGFKLRDGSVQLTVPSVPPKDDYIIVLMGDSGNTSPTFSITKITNGGSAQPPSSFSSSTETLALPSKPILPSPPATPSPSSASTSSTPSASSTLLETSTTPTTTSTSSSTTTTTTSSSSSSSSAPAGSLGASNSSGASSHFARNTSSLTTMTMCIASAVLFLLV